MEPRPLIELTREEYDMLLISGFLWELYPEATGNYEVDVLGEANVSD